MFTKFSKLFLLGSIPWVLTCCQSSDPIDQKIDRLLNEMSLEEKVGQMAQITLDVVAKGNDRYSSFEPMVLDTGELRKAIVEYHVGSILNTTNNRARTPEQWYGVISEIQRIALQEQRVKIPIIYGIDAIHGVTYTVGATMFPHEITLAASFNPIHARHLAEVTAYEARASSIPWNFSPVLDLGADPRFPRQFEGFGEDPYLITIMGKEMVKGYEGKNNDVANPEKVASCIKHFMGYSVPISGKDRTPAYIPEHVLREYHLPPFEAAIKAGAKSIMINSGQINGISTHADYKMLTSLLQEELGFKGLIVSDWADIENLYKRDKVATSIKDAVRLAVNAGIDMSMISYQYEPFCQSLIELVKEGAVKESRVDQAVRKILRLKIELNLFDKPTTNPADYPKFGSKEFAQYSYDAAADAITLLKNDENLLPLSPQSRLLIVGPNAHSMRPLNGGWSYSWQGEKTDEYTEHFNTIYEALATVFGKERVNYVAGVEYEPVIEYYKERKKDFEKVLPAARNCDVIVLCLGENSYTEGPGNLNDLYLSDLQHELAREAAKVGKPIILVLNEGRPRIISKIEPMMKAVIHTYLPGNYGGDALAHILSGKINPSGRLPYTYPRTPNSLGVYYHKPAEKVGVMEGAYNYSADFAPQYAFGHGLSYTSFAYANLKVSSDKVTDQDEITVTVDVTNNGTRDGKETVMLFTTDEYASMTPDVKRLRRFEKIDLKMGETRTLTFKLPIKELAFVNQENRWTTEAGEYTLRIGDLTQKVLLQK